MDCSIEAWSMGYCFSYLPAVGASTPEMFFPGSWVVVYSSDWIQLECEICFTVTLFTSAVCVVLYRSGELRSKEVILTRCNFLKL
jgi:hypothetical protein